MRSGIICAISQEKPDATAYAPNLIFECSRPEGNFKIGFAPITVIMYDLHLQEVGNELMASDADEQGCTQIIFKKGRMSHSFSIYPNSLVNPLIE